MDLIKYRQAAEIQIKVRKWLQEYIKPDMNIYDVCCKIENELKKELNYDSNNHLHKSIAYPIGININNCAAHWSPLNDDNSKFSKNDMIKFDFGVQIDGCIIDSAYTHIFDSKYDQLLECSKDALYMGIKNSGVDAILEDIGSSIQEVITSYEIELDGKNYQIKPIYDLCGHNIGKYKIHNGKAVPNVKINYPVRMQEDEIYAIEPYCTTGSGKITYEGECSHYMLNSLNPHIDNKTRKLYNMIRNRYDTLPFDKKWLKEFNISQNDISMGLFKLANNKIINTYKPVYDVKNSYIAQYEHTIHIGQNKVEILTQSDDF
jgi:methionyl aminopeptidase